MEIHCNQEIIARLATVMETAILVMTATHFRGNAKTAKATQRVCFVRSARRGITVLPGMATVKVSLSFLTQ